MTIAIVLTAYFFGSIPFAWIFAWGVAGVDVRSVGSGNVGATNVLRTSGTTAAFLTAALDVAKGAAAVGLAQWLGASGGVAAAAGVAAVLGHVYPVWLKFRGGKGVAAACGAFLVLAPAATGMAIAVFVLTVWGSRFVSAGSVAAAVALAPLVYLADASRSTVGAATVAAFLIVMRHRANIIRLLDGSEPRLGVNDRLDITDDD
jgi:glycerol-3-phosphate acyltransferase PlsY